MTASGSNLSEHSSNTESSFSSSSFQEPNCQQKSLDSVTFHLPTIIIQPEPISTLPPLHTPFSSESSSTSVGNQGSINMAVPAFVMNRNAPFQLPQSFNQMPHVYHKIIPRFTGEYEQTAEDHVSIFCNFADSLNVEHLDVILSLFVQSLDGETRKWFKGLPNNFIPSWEEMERLFI